jgi:hypothetical protein
VTFATYAAAAIIVAASLLVGRAALRLLRRDGGSWLDGPVGLAILLAVCSISVRLPHRATTTVFILLAILVASVVILRGRILPSGASLALAAPAALIALLAASLPFIASGNVGILGIGVNNDLAGHLHYAAWLLDPTDLVPHNIRAGYPLGPQGLAAALSNATGMEPLSAILGFLLAIPVLTAIAAMALLDDLRVIPRTIAGALTALPYIAAATFGIGGFKETVMGLFAVALVLTLREISLGEGDRRGLLVVIGVLLAGMLGVYSYPGVAYGAAILAVWAILETIALARSGEGARVRAMLVTGAKLSVIPLILLALAAIVAYPQIKDFAGQVGDIFHAPSRLKDAVSPLESLGAWPSGDFLRGTDGLASPWIFGAIGLIGLVVGALQAVRRRELALLAGLIGLGLIYLETVLSGGLYVQAKALGIIAPLLMLVILRGLLEPSDAPAQARAPYLRLGFAIGFIVIASYSTFLALRDSRVAPREYAAAQLGKFRPLLHNKQVLSLTSDRFTDYYLRGANVLSPARFAEENVLPRKGKFERLPVDFDSVVPGALDRFDYAITTSAAYKSAPPSNFKEVGSTDDFILWKRTGKTPLIGVLPEEERPGALFNCRNRKLRQIVGDAEKNGYTTARVQPASVIGKRLFWSPGSTLNDGDQIHQLLVLPKGRWHLSIQYYSPVLDLTVDAPGLHKTLTPTGDGGVVFRTDQGPFWPLGTVVSRGGPMQVTVRAGGLSRLQKLLGVDQGADIGNVTAARPEDAREIPLRQACGQYVDHFSVGHG